MTASTTPIPKAAKKTTKAVSVRQPKRPYKRVDAAKLVKHVECFTKQVDQHKLKVETTKTRLDALTEKLSGYTLKLDRYVQEQTFRAAAETEAV